MRKSPLSLLALQDDSQGATKKFRLFGLTNSVPVYERYISEKETECGGGGGVGYHWLSLAVRKEPPQLNLDDLTPYI
jgi:hypothetical protein